MVITKQRVTCQACEKVGDVDIVVNAPISVAAASLTAARCPRCGSDKLGLGGDYDDAPPLTASIEDRAMWWKDRGEVGTSSETIWSVFTHSPAPRHGAWYPLDPDDFKRCWKLLKLIPEWRSSLSVVTKKYPWFAPFEAHWDEYEQMFEERWDKKYKNGKSEALAWTPLYDAMNISVREAAKIMRKTA